IGRSGGSLEQEGLLLACGRLDLEDRPRQAQPVAAIVGCDGRDLAEDLKTAAEIGSLEGDIGIGPQRWGRFGDGAGFALDLGLELDRRVSEIVALESFIGR